MEKEAMRQLLDSIVEARRKEDSFLYEQPVFPEPGPPASESDLLRLDTHLASLGLQVPESYRMAMSIYNGIDHLFEEDFGLLPIDAVVERRYNLLRALEKMVPNCCRFVIAAGNVPDIIGFDTSAPAADGGYEVVSVGSDGSQWRTPTFEKFLTEYLAVRQEAIASEEKDRQGLTDTTPEGGSTS
jgi:hypothetical protein